MVEEKLAELKQLGFDGSTTEEALMFCEIKINDNSTLTIRTSNCRVLQIGVKNYHSISNTLYIFTFLKPSVSITGIHVKDGSNHIFSINMISSFSMKNRTLS